MMSLSLMTRRSPVHPVIRISALAWTLSVAGCMQWPPTPETVTLTEVDASRPTVAVTPDGAVLTTWVSTGEEGGNVLVARSEDGRTFGTPVRANDVDGDAAPHDQAPAQIALGPGDEVYVVWQNNTQAEGRRFPYSDLRFARSNDGGRTFAPAITVNDDVEELPSSHTFHSMLVGPDGAIWIAWIDGRARAAAEAAAMPHGAAEAQPGGAEPAAGHAGMGHHMSEADMPGSQIRIARSDDGGRTFGQSALVADVACPCCRTAMALGPDGTLNLAWRGVRDGDIREIVVARSADGGATFTDPAIVHRDGWRIEGCPHAGPSLAYDGAGRLRVAWYTGVDGAPGVFHASSSDGGATFSEPEALLSGDWVPVSLVSLGADAQGRVWAAWDDRRTEPLTVHIAPLDDPGAATAVSGKAATVATGSDVVAVATLDGTAVRTTVLRQR